MGISLRSSQGRPRESTNRKWLKSTDQGKVWCHHKVFIDFSLILEKSLLCAAPPPAPWVSTCPRPILWLWTRVHLPPGSLVNRYCLERGLFLSIFGDFYPHESCLPWLFSKFVSSVWARGKERWWGCMYLPQEEEGEDPCRDEALPSPGQLHLPEKGPCEDFFLDQPRW